MGTVSVTEILRRFERAGGTSDYCPIGLILSEGEPKQRDFIVETWMIGGKNGRLDFGFLWCLDVPALVGREVLQRSGTLGLWGRIVYSRPKPALGSKSGQCRCSRKEAGSR